MAAVCHLIDLKVVNKDMVDDNHDAPKTHAGYLAQNF